MYVNVRLETEPVKEALTIPAEAVLHSGEKRTGFVVLGDGKFEPRQVKTGLQSEEGDIEIIQGLLDGDHVVTSAQFMLDSESKLREAIQKMLKPKKPSTDEHAGHTMAEGEQDEDLEDLFDDDEEDLESLFEEEEER